MIRIILLLGMFLAGTLLFACAPKVAQMERPGVSEIPLPGVPATEKEPWQVKWDETLAKANREGTVIVYGPPLAEVRQGFIEGFQRKFPGIKLEYTGMRGADTSPKIKAERRAGLYVVDVHIGGTTTMLTQIREFLVPIRHFLILPESIDPNHWLEGRLDFSDKAEELNLVFTINANSRVVYNTDHVKPDEITSWFDLLNPEWKEKIIMWDPRAAGSGLATATFWYLTPKLGLDYIRAFAINKPVLTRDQRMQAENVARGRHYFSIASGTTEVFEFRQLGMPLIFAEVLKEGTYSSAAFGSVAVLDKAPHPNAAAVFLNWLLSREGQTIWATKGGYVSRRLDVPQDHVLETERVKPGVFYMPNYKEEIVMTKDEIIPHLNEIFKGF